MSYLERHVLWEYALSLFSLVAVIFSVSTLGLLPMYMKETFYMGIEVYDLITFSIAQTAIDGHVYILMLPMLSVIYQTWSYQDTFITLSSLRISHKRFFGKQISLMSLLTLLFSSVYVLYVLPVSYQLQRKTLDFNINKAIKKMPTKTFSQYAGFTLYVHSIKGQELRNVLISQHLESANIYTVYVADRVLISQSDTYVLLTMLDGRMHIIPDGETMRNVSLLEFKKKILKINMALISDDDGESSMKYIDTISLIRAIIDGGAEVKGNHKLKGKHISASDAWATMHKRMVLTILPGLLTVLFGLRVVNNLHIRGSNVMVMFNNFTMCLLLYGIGAASTLAAIQASWVIVGYTVIAACLVWLIRIACHICSKPQYFKQQAPRKL